MSKPSRIFRLQNDDHLGRVDSSHSPNEVIELVGSDPLAGRVQANAFLHTTLQSNRFKLVGILVTCCFLLFLGRSAQLQIVEGDTYAIRSDANHFRTELIVPERGIITDRYGITLAQNEPMFVLTMTIADLPRTDEERGATFEEIASLVGLQRTDLDLLYSDYINRPYDLIPVIEDIDYERAIRLAIEVSRFQGFQLETKTRRSYLSSIPSLSHVIGYTGGLSQSDLTTYADQGYRPIDEIGKTGVERTAESLLRGIPGTATYEVDARGNRLSIVSKQEATPGANISLSIDADFQKYIEQQLQETLDRVGATNGSVVAIDPQTGAIRALVSMPTYDANEFVGGISADRYKTLLEDETNPLFPRATAGEFPSGSTFKPFVTYAALAEGIVKEHSSFISTGGIQIGQWYFPDWKAGGHGITDARKALAESVNTYYYIIGGGYDQVTGLGVSRITDYASRFGFGEKTGIDLPTEADGFLPSKEWKEEAKGERWYVGDTYHLAIGQGDFLTTPLQMARGTAIIANGGQTFTPYLVESVDGFGSTDLADSTFEPIQDLDPFSLLIVQQGMRQTVTLGSARSLSTLSEKVAGKTGTAQTIGDRPYHSWFTGFAPYDNPDIALVVLVEEGGGSNDAAVPLAKTLFNWWFTFR